MPENLPFPKEPAHVQDIPKEELFSAAEVMLAMVKTSKGFKMYMPNNPLLARFVEELTGKMGNHLAAYGDFRLDIDQFELRYRGKVVYENRDPKESMAFKMYSDGIQTLVFNEGAEEREICEVLDIIGKDRPGDADDDIVTLLWEKDLPNVRYILAEDSMDYETAGVATTLSPQKEKIRGLFQSVSATDQPPPLLTVPQHILSLTEEETDWLKKAREADERTNPLEEVAYILSAILVAEKDLELFGDFADIMIRLTGNLIHSGEIKYALSLIRFLRGLATNEQISPASCDRLANAVSGTFSGEMVKVLETYLDATDKISPDELKELLTFFGKHSISAMCGLLGQVQKMTMRKVILEKLVEYGKESPQALFPFLTDNRWYLVRNIVFILTKIGDPATLEPVSRLISHKEPRIRKEVLSFLETIPDPKAKTYMTKFLNDENSAIRIRAMQSLAAVRYAPALKMIFAMTSAKDFEERDSAEKKAVYETLGELGSDQVVPLFREMLMKKFWFNKAKEKESVYYAIAGLRKVRTDAALQLLKEAGDSKGDEAKVMITQAIKAIAAELAKGGTAP